MKRSTLIILLIAVVGAVMVYYLEIKDAKPRDEQPETTKAAFSFKREDIVSVSLTRTNETILLEQSDGKWSIKQPVTAAANESAVDSLVSDLVNARIERTFSASNDEIKSFGLADPMVTITLKLKSGPEHKLRIGTKDFSNLSVYGIIDDAKDVALLPASLSTSAEKSLNDLRDLSILGGLSQFDISSLAVKNSSGGFSLAKENSEWVIKAPTPGPADEGEISTLLSEVTSARATEVASEKDGDLASFGLAPASTVVTARLEAGGERQISLGTRTDATGKSYYAKSTDRPEIFKIDASLFEKLEMKPGQLRSKQLVKVDASSLTRVQVKNSNLTLSAEKNDEGKWIIRAPADQKDKEVPTSKLWDPLEATKATEIVDKPSAAVLGRLAKPAVEIRLTTKDGKTTIVKISAADGDSAYVRVEGRADIYKVGKQLVEDLSYKAADLVP